MKIRSEGRQLFLPLAPHHPEVAVPVPLPRGRDAALERIAADHLRRLGFDSLVPILRVIWNPRLGSTAGQALHADFTITLNPHLVTISVEEVHRTLLHELAHLIAYARSPYRKIPSHGRLWRQACADLGIPGESSRHTLALPRRRVARKYFYRCPSCGVELGRVRPLRRAVACSVCCRKHNGGCYHDRFRFEKCPPPLPETPG